MTKKLEYEAVKKAKETVDKIPFWEMDEDYLIHEISRLDLTCRCVIACGSFYNDIRYGISFFMPKTNDVMKFNVSRLEGDDRTDGVEYRITSSINDANQHRFYCEESEKHVYACRYI